MLKYCLPMALDGELSIRAAGCVVYRTIGTAEGSDEVNNTRDMVEVLLVHRPRYDDWDFPKGKLESGETELECAIRETAEESGYSGDIEKELEPVRYEVNGVSKVVRYWMMRQNGGEFAPNEEVDAVRWLPIADALKLLSYEHARNLLRAAF